MLKSQILINKIDKVLDEQECDNFHCVELILLDCAQQGRLFRIQENSKYIDKYFRYSPEVYDYIKNYSINKLLKFLERIVKNYKFIGGKKR